MNYRTYLDFDFTAQSNQTLTTNGTYSIGGMTWTKGNSANDATAMAVTNGSGLVIIPNNSTTDYNDSARTLPYLWLPFNQIPGLGTLSWQSKLRIWAYVSADNITVNQYDNAVVAVDSNSVGLGYLAKRGVGTAGVGLQSQIDCNGNGGYFGNTFTLGVANKVMVLDIDLKGVFATFVGQYSSGWPDPSTLTYIASITSGPTSLAGGGLTNPFSTMGILLGAQRYTSVTSLSITFARLRVDVIL